MTDELAGKVALVTGAAGGIGAASAVELARAGAQVFLADLTCADETLERIEMAGGSAYTVVCDVSQPADVDVLFGAIEQRSSGLDIAVNSAGILVESNLLDMSVESFDRIVAVNLRGTFLIAKGAVALMRARGQGA